MATYRPATVQYGENDVFGLFDILAFSPNHGRMHAVQVKSNRASGIRSWHKHTALFRALGFRTFYLVPYDHEGWRLIEAESDGTQTLVDERETEGKIGEDVREYLREL
jgi:hypothetical protein